MTHLTADQMIGAPLMKSRRYVFVCINAVKHLYIGERPCTGDATACGIRIGSPVLWSQRSLALPAKKYCRECERVQRDTE